MRSQFKKRKELRSELNQLRIRDRKSHYQNQFAKKSGLKVSKKVKLNRDFLGIGGRDE